MQKSRLTFLGLIVGAALIFLIYYLKLPTLTISYYQSLVDDTHLYESEATITKRGVVFFKTHKTGGSSLQNMFMRYSHEHSMLMLLPRFFNYIGHPQLFQKRFSIELKHGYRYSLFAHHTRFSYKGLLSVFNPKKVEGEDPTFVTIVREPVSLFESLYAYYNGNELFGANLATFAESDKSNLRTYNNRLAHRIGINQMCYDLGVEPQYFEDDDYIRKKAAVLDSQFDLVMISERMDESLVLLKNLINWTVDDVVVFHHNARADDTKKILNEKQKQGILRWNSADKILYDYFLIRFQERVDAFGKGRMEEELQILRQRTREWYDFCVVDERSSSDLDGDQQPYSSLVKGFKLKNSDNATCSDLTKAELQFTDELRNLQKKFWLKP